MFNKHSTKNSTPMRLQTDNLLMVFLLFFFFARLQKPIHRLCVYESENDERNIIWHIQYNFTKYAVQIPLWLLFRCFLSSWTKQFSFYSFVYDIQFFGLVRRQKEKVEGKNFIKYLRKLPKTPGKFNVYTSCFKVISVRIFWNIWKSISMGNNSLEKRSRVCAAPGQMLRNNLFYWFTIRQLHFSTLECCLFFLSLSHSLTRSISWNINLQR